MKYLKILAIIIISLTSIFFLVGGWASCKYSTGGEADNGWFYNLVDDFGKMTFCRK